MSTIAKQKLLSRSFYERPTLDVAKKLLGKKLVRKINGRVYEGYISETEAYIGEDDKACHASRGRTKRTEVMYGEAGRAYVYLIYGMYNCLNIVTEREGFPAAVLIRGIISPKNLLNGPGKLARWMEIDKAMSGHDMTARRELFVTEGMEVNPKSIMASHRIGVDYAGNHALKKWRFTI